ncbi:MAG: YcfL family protein [Verrucomicrobiae bacterium]|nr:YcfL family protein [Verrucomicrobiae bacterium]
MNRRTTGIVLLSLLAAALAGCSSHQGPYPPKGAEAAAWAKTGQFQLMDPGARKSVTTLGLQESRLDDGRLKVSCIVLNLENRRIQVQAQCVFKDASGFSTGDETPWENVILTENSTETLTFTSLNPLASAYAVRIRQAR